VQQFRHLGSVETRLKFGFPRFELSSGFRLGPYDDEPRFSFDGKRLAYNSEVSGKPEVYLVSFPATDKKKRLSTDGGVQPRWIRDGRELYYLALDGRLMVVDLRLDTEIEASVPQPLSTRALTVDALRDQFAASPDGQRFLVQLPAVDADPTPITVVLNWTTARASSR
jgi:hypothetical protein